MHGKSDIETFKLKLNRRDIAEIADVSKELRITDSTFIRLASYDDVHTAYILLSLQEFFKARNCEIPFELVLSE